MDGEPPAKRARRTDHAATRDRNGTPDIASPHSSQPPVSDRDNRSRTQHEDTRNGGYGLHRDEDRRKRSRSPRDRRERRSRSPRGDRGYRERDRRGKDDYGRSDRDRQRDRSKDRHRSSRVDDRVDRRRSRSPHRNGTSTPSSRPRSPARSRLKVEDERERDIKRLPPVVNGSTLNSDTKSASIPRGTKSEVKSEMKSEMKEEMDVDDPNDPDLLLKRLMGFSTFKTTQNTKVPGNQIYGVRKEKKTEYRQYMNRVGGFNRPLSPGR